MRNALLIASMLLSGCSVLHASALKTGRLVVTLTDKETGGPITNATVTVRSCIVSSMGPTLDSHYRNTSAQANSNGIADVEFEFRSNRFVWWVSSPTHHCVGSRSPYEHFNAVVVPSAYTHINTNTVEGLAKYNELKALHESDSVEDYLSLVHKFEPQSVTYTNNVLYRSASFYPKHNPRPMYAYGDRLDTKLPETYETIASNDVSVLHFPAVEFDMKKGLFLPPYGGRGGREPGEVADFRVERFCIVTNNVRDYFGWMEFAPGCGAYKCSQTGDASFPTTYVANTNAVFLPKITYEYQVVDNKLTNEDLLLGEHEYMVLRTRSSVCDGVVTNCHYSKISGRMWAGANLHFEQSVFNPTPNDPNLEFDTSQNLADEERRQSRWP